MDLIREMWKQAFAWMAFTDAAGCAREAVRRCGDGEPGGSLLIRMLVQGMISSYAMPFRQRRSVRLGEETVDPGRIALHRRLLELRDRAVIHRDPAAGEGFDNSVEMAFDRGAWRPLAPGPLMSPFECGETASLAEDLAAECARRLDELTEAVGRFRDLTPGAIEVRPVQEGGRVRYAISRRATGESRDGGGEPGAEASPSGGRVKLYDELSWLWPLWGGPGEYRGYCEHAAELIRERSAIPVRTILDIGCGGGKNAFNLKRDFEVTGLDLSPRMLELARGLNPECEFVQGDMRSFSLGRTFDAVFIDDAIAYMTSREDLGDALSAARRHLNPGGVMIVTPDATREGFVQNSTSATPASVPEGVSGIDAAFVENSYDPDPGDDTYETTMVFLIREEGRPRVEVDRHVLGLFGRDAWRGMLAEAGFVVTEKEYSESGSDYLTFACLRPPV